ncbi:hypothetical protein N656DRAFT_404353 [Canariomyces notabilis]|uniref:Uncharacterized protein n=1 Tax=Canariomyces notabilis TaxID=2074819 RepID=A0AAN6TJX9_9PEZI|nr:hypothetical protein N656DRAFT_404353 [Canariomyces arenarius]
MHSEAYSSLCGDWVFVRCWIIDLIKGKVGSKLSAGHTPVGQGAGALYSQIAVAIATAIATLLLRHLRVERKVRTNG